MKRYISSLCLLIIFVAEYVYSDDESGKCTSGNCVNGEGTFTYSNDNKYDGQFKDGKRNGQGTYTWSNGKKYVGQWRDNKIYGRGTMYGPDGSILKKGR